MKHFEDAVRALLPVEALYQIPTAGPHFLLHEKEEISRKINANRAAKKAVFDLSEIEDEIKRTLKLYGYNSNGEIIGSSVIHENLTTLIEEYSPELINKKGRIPFNIIKNFTEIYRDPFSVSEVYTNKTMRIIWAAYFYLLACGECIADLNNFPGLRTADAKRNLSKSSLLLFGHDPGGYRIIINFLGLIDKIDNIQLLIIENDFDLYSPRNKVFIYGLFFIVIVTIMNFSIMNFSIKSNKKEINTVKDVTKEVILLQDIKVKKKSVLDEKKIIKDQNVNIYFSEKFSISVEDAIINGNELILSIILRNLGEKETKFLVSSGVTRYISGRKELIQKPYIMDEFGNKYPAMKPVLRGEAQKHLFQHRGFGAETTFKVRLNPNETVSANFAFPKINESSKTVSLIIPKVNGWQGTLKIDGIQIK